MNSVLLTIDDVASANTPAIVDFLNEKGIRPILFAAGVNVERFYDEAVYAVKNGMLVGNHSYSHRAFSMLSFEECVEEVEKCECVLDKLYQDSGVQRGYRPFRFPYGDKGGANQAALQAYFRRRGFDKVDDAHIPYPWWKQGGMDEDVDTFWTFDFEEYRMQHEAEFTEKNVWEKVNDPCPRYGAALFGQQNRHIILMHAHDETEAIMPGYCQRLITHLLEKGVVFDEPQFIKTR